MVTGFHPFLASTREELNECIETGFVKFPLRFGLSYDCIDFINECLQVDWREDRASVSELIKHPFLIQTIRHDRNSQYTP